MHVIHVIFCNSHVFDHGKHICEFHYIYSNLNIRNFPNTKFPPQQGSKLEAAIVRHQWHLKVEKLGVKFMTAFEVMLVKTKFIVAKYDERPLISSPAP